MHTEMRAGVTCNYWGTKTDFDPLPTVAALLWVAVMQRERSFASHWKIRLIAPKRSLAFTTA